MSDATQAVLFNAVPLFVLAASYAAVAVAMLPEFWRQRARAHLVDWGVVLVFPAVAAAAGIFGVLVVVEQRAVAGHVWLSLVAVLLAIVPAGLLLARLSDRPLVAGRAAEAEHLGAVTAISEELVRARNEVDVARPLVRHVSRLFEVGFAAVTLVDEGGTSATGLYAEMDGSAADWWPEVRVDLRHEPSGIARAVADAAPVDVYDVDDSPLVSRRLATRVGARSAVFVPMIAESGVLGVLAAASTGERRPFAADELGLLQAVAAEAALALERLRSSAALAEALRRERTAAEIASRLRAELEPERVAAVAADELRRFLTLDRAEVVLGSAPRAGVAVEARGDRVATLVLERTPGLGDSELLLVDAVARELGSALQTARLLSENERRLSQQQALLHTAQVVTGELSLDAVLVRLVEEVTTLLGVDAADCYLVDHERGVLRCAAVYGFDAALVGFEFAPEAGVGDGGIEHPAYAGFSRALVAPMAWAGETFGLLGVGVRDAGRRFEDDDVELLGAFASLAALALRNAESFEASVRSAQLERGFSRIASLLGESLSTTEAYGAASQAAAEALGADFAAVLAPTASGLVVAGDYGFPDAIRALDVPVALDDARAGGHLLAASSLAEDDRFDAAWQASSIASLLAIPLPDAASGVVLVCFLEPRTFTRDDLRLAQEVAAAAHGALERSRLFETERAERSLSQKLARAAAALTSELDPGAVLWTTAREAVGLVGADAALVSMLDGDELTIAATAGAAAAGAHGARSPATDGAAADVLAARGPVALDAAAEPSHAFADPVLGEGLRGYLGVPFAAGEDEQRGVLSVYSSEPRAWRPEEIEALATLAANAVVALSNAELHRRVAVEREQSAAILANIADGIVAVDRQGQVVLWNGAAADITGIPAVEAIGRTPTDVLRRELQSETGATSTRLVSISRGDEEVWLALSEAVMRDPGGAVVGRIFAFRDISAEYAIEQMKSDFVSSVSLELRAPLTTIYGFAQTLLRDDVTFSDDDRRTFLEFMGREAERLTLTVDALLQVARLETGDLSVTLEPTDVRAVVSELVASATTSGRNGNRVVAEIAADVPRARADPVKLRDVLDQLVSNAVKFSPGGGTVTVSARRSGDAVELAVADQGSGIPVSERERIFDKFVKSAGGRGTGVGLFIAQGLVREMGGRIHVDSEEGGGSRFAFELPLVRE
ncbi:MAG TPA: GAF domain-containing protein [Gaiellaceae bacterium]